MIRHNGSCWLASVSMAAAFLRTVVESEDALAQLKPTPTEFTAG
jgi:hypothetical protein